MFAKNGGNHDEKTSHRFGIVVLKTVLSVSKIPVWNGSVNLQVLIHNPGQNSD